MYYEEKLIEGKWHWRNDPNGEWVQFSEDDLDRKILTLKNQLSAKDKEIERLKEKFNLLWTELSHAKYIDNDIAIYVREVCQEALKEKP